MQALSDVLKSITDTTNNPPEETEVEPVPYEASSGAISKREELEATGKFSSSEIDNILATVEEPAEEQ